MDDGRNGEPRRSLSPGLLMAVSLAAGLLACVALVVMRRSGRRHSEVTALIVCETMQQAAYSALARYKEDKGVLPSELSVLVEGGYLPAAAMSCPGTYGRSPGAPYSYFAGGFGDPKSVVLSDAAGSHAGRQILRANPATVVTLGDGTTWCMVSVADAIAGASRW